MKRITIDARFYNASGLGSYLKGVIGALEKFRGYKLYCLCSKEESFNFENPIVMNSRCFTLQEQFEFRDKIPPCELFFAPHFNIPIFPIKAKKRLTTLCDAYHLDHFKYLTFFQKIYAFLFFNAVMFLSDHVITISQFSKERLFKKCRKIPKKITVIYPGVDEKAFLKSFSQEKKEKICLKYGLPKRFFLFVGNFKPHKNIKRLVLAYHLFLQHTKEKDPPHLLLVGKTEGFIHRDHSIEPLINTSSDLKHSVKIMGFIEDDVLKNFYQMSELLIFPSLYEGFGLPLLEAMAAGCPIVASNIATFHEVCGEAALFVDPYDIFLMKEAIEKIMYDKTLRENLIAKGKERVKHFSLELNGLKHLSLIENELNFLTHLTQK